MTARALLRLELAQLVRRPLTWAVLALLAAAMLAGSLVGAERVRTECATVARVQAEAAQAVVNVKAAARRYAEPSAMTIPVFRDPTDAYSYMYNFLQTYAVKPPAPLAAIAAGQSDLQPVFIRINLQSVFPDTAYELRSPRILALGAFDLGFVLVYLLPLAVIALGGASLTAEQDSGVLRLIAAQPIGPRVVAAAKFGALALLLAPTVAVSAVLAAVAAGVGVGAGLLVLALLVLLYTVFWVALCALVASLWRGAVQSLAILVLGWAAFTVLLPAVAALALSAVYPAPSRIAYIDASRTLADQAPDSFEWEAGAVRWLASRPELGPATPARVGSAEVGRMAHDAYFSAGLAPQRRAFALHADRMVRASDALRLLSPASALDGGLQALARTDTESQLAFTAAAARYGDALRRHFEPLILANIDRVRACSACPGRLNFAGYDDVPTFRIASETKAGLSRELLVALYLLIVTSTVFLMAARRFGRWPIQ